MAEISVKTVIETLDAKVKLVEEKKNGAVVARHLVTEVKLQYEGTPAKLDDVLYALMAGNRIDVTFHALQLSLDGSPAEVTCMRLA